MNNSRQFSRYWRQISFNSSILGPNSGLAHRFWYTKVNPLILLFNIVPYWNGRSLWIKAFLLRHASSQPQPPNLIWHLRTTLSTHISYDPNSSFPCFLSIHLSPIGTCMATLRDGFAPPASLFSITIPPVFYCLLHFRVNWTVTSNEDWKRNCVCILFFHKNTWRTDWQANFVIADISVHLFS